MKILIADAFDASLPKRLEKYGEVTTDMAEVATAQVLLIRSKTKVTKEMVAEAKQLKLVIRGGVGLDNVDKEACKARGVEVMNTAAASAVSVAEMAMAFMVAIPARLIEAHMAMKEGKFPKNELKRTELFQKTLGLIGAGAIATEVAKRALGFGMKVIAYDPFLTSHPLAELKTLDEVLAQADAAADDQLEVGGLVDHLLGDLGLGADEQDLGLGQFGHVGIDLAELLEPLGQGRVEGVSDQDLHVSSP